MSQHNDSEFDRYAKNYHDLHAASIRISGEASDYFARYKVEEVARLSDSARERGGNITILDFGCGVGGCIRFFAEIFPAAELHGVDVSKESLSVANASYPDSARFVAFDGDRLPYEDASFDLVFTSCVFHHISPDQWMSSMREIRRVLRTNGEFFIFEHNPWNPLTRKVVRDCPFDEHAVLLSAPRTAGLVRAAGFRSLRVRYSLFFPRSLAMLRPLEKFLSAVPIGAQYFVQAQP